MDTIPVTRSSLPSFEEYCAEIKPLWETCWLTNMGEKHRRLQLVLEEYLGVPHVTLFANGHLALEAAIRGLQLTGEVITTPFTFASTTQAIVRCGCTPVFCDIRENDYTLDAGKIEALITEKTSAILPVHVYGNICDIEAIQHIADRYGLKVIYDAAHTFGERLNGQSVTAFGDISMLSFHAAKVFNTIEGGALCYRDSGLSAMLDSLKNFGVTETGEYNVAGGNAKMNEFQAAMGLCNLKHVDANIRQRESIALRYRQNLSGITGLKLCAEQPGVESNYAYFPVVFDGYLYTRDEAADKLAAHNIYARKYFYPLTSSFSCYRGRFDLGGTPLAQYISERVLCLPLYAELTQADVDRVCETISS